MFPRKIGEYRFMFMSYSSIDEEIKKNNGECYFTSSDVQIIGSKAKVNLKRISAGIYRFENSSKYTRWIGGEGYAYELEKLNNKWQIISSEKVLISS